MFPASIVPRTFFFALNCINAFKGTINIPPKNPKNKKIIARRMGLATSVEIYNVNAIPNAAKGMVPTSI